MKHAFLPVLLLSVPALAACTQNADPSEGDPRAIAVTSSADACDLTATEAPAGTLRFDVTNTGDDVTEFYLLGEDGLRIVGEVENIGPGLDRQLVVTAPAGDYVTACKPGMTGQGIRADFEVTESGEDVEVSADDQALIEQATTNYAAYVRDQSDQLVTRTQDFVDAYVAGDDEQARAIYADARVHWERIETVAESFGDLDPKMDSREADLEPGQKWSGWHLLEKDLWPARAEDYTPLTAKQRTYFADDLMTNTRVLDKRIQDMSFTVDQVANGSRGLLEEVATGTVTGEEEHWSRTDLWDFQANVDGARVGYEGVRPLVEREDPELATTLDQRFAALHDLLDEQRTADGFTYYDDLAPEEVKALADAVNALSEPLSRLTATVLA